MSPQIPVPQNLPGARKAAIFLMGIGDQIGADLIRQLAPDEIRRISNEITAMSSVQPDSMLNIFREFESLTATSRFFAKGGFDRAKKLLEQAVGKGNRRQGVMNEVAPDDVVGIFRQAFIRSAAGCAWKHSDEDGPKNVILLSQ